MEVVLLAPLATTAMDMALDTASGGAILACGSGRKLKTAITRAVAPPTLAVKKSRPCPLMYSLHKRFPQETRSQKAHHIQSRLASSLVPSDMSEANATRPHVFEHSVVPNPRSSAACSSGEASWVSDPGDFMSRRNREALQTLMDDLYVKTGSECTLVVLANLRGHGSDLKGFRTFGTALFNHWGVGSAAHNNGILIAFFHEARRLEIVTGAGMSTILSDTWLAGMQQRDMVPHFKAGNHFAGLSSGIEAINQRLQSRAPQEWRNIKSPLALDDGNASDALVPSFGGGHCNHRSTSRQVDYNRDPAYSSSDSSEALFKSWPWLLLGVGMSLLGDDSSPELRRLQNQLRKLEEAQTSSFCDANGEHVAWPYQASHETMGLWDAAPETSESHPFTLASKGKLTIVTHAKSFGRDSLSVTYRNASSSDILVELPAGSLFVPSTSQHVQPLISTKATSLILGPGEEKTVLLDAYCGDSGASVPHGTMVLSPYRLHSQHLLSQASVWRCLAPYQRRSSNESPAIEEFHILEDSFNMRKHEAEELFRELRLVNDKSHSERLQQIRRLKDSIQKEHDRSERARERSRSSSFGQSGGTSFGGGCSSGGGAGCSWYNPLD